MFSIQKNSIIDKEMYSDISTTIGSISSKDLIQLRIRLGPPRKLIWPGLTNNTLGTSMFSCLLIRLATRSCH